MVTPIITIPSPSWEAKVHLTHMRLNPGRRGTARLLASAQRMHAAVLLGFPGLDTESERVLWRIDQPSSHDVNLLIVSPREPDLTHVIEQAGWPTSPEATWRSRPYGPFLERLDAGQRWAFRVRVNPVVRKRDPARDNRIMTIPHLTVAQQEQWLVDRADRLGVNFTCGSDKEPTVHLTHRTTGSFERRNAAQSQGRDVTIASAELDGLMEIVDPDLLRSALTAGIGRAKAYGCGLMTLATPRS